MLSWHTPLTALNTAAVMYLIHKISLTCVHSFIVAYECGEDVQSSLQGMCFDRTCFVAVELEYTEDGYTFHTAQVIDNSPTPEAPLSRYIDGLQR